MSLLRSSPAFCDNLVPVRLPFEQGVLEGLAAGTLIGLTGTMFTGRDQTHRRLIALLDEGRDLPVDLEGQLLYYVGPSPARPGQVVGAAGPTTSCRMDLYTPRLLELGLKATLGKGARGQSVRQAMVRAKAAYFVTIGGAGALLSKSIVAAELIAFPDAGPEAMFRFQVENFPAVVINDLTGNDYYEMMATRRS